MVHINCVYRSFVDVQNTSGCFILKRQTFKDTMCYHLSVHSLAVHRDEASVHSKVRDKDETCLQSEPKTL